MQQSIDAMQRLARLRRKLWEAKVWLSGFGLALIAFGLLHWLAGIQLPDVQIPATPAALGAFGLVLLALGSLAGGYAAEAQAVAAQLGDDALKPK